jgi:hypothetical protein
MDPASNQGDLEVLPEHPNVAYPLNNLGTLYRE